LAASAHAMTTYNVTPGDAASLLNAVDQANNDGDDSTVNVPAGTYNLSTSDQIEIFGDGTFTLTGAGARSTIIDGGGGPVVPGDVTGNNSLFYISAFNPTACKGLKIISCISPADATISGVTVQNANPDSDGGAFYVQNAGATNLATLHLYDSTVTNNQSENDGGGIFNEGTLDVQRVTFSNNYAEADGAAIATKSYNEALGASRGISTNNFATTTIINSTFTGNIADSDTGCEGGGAIEQQTGNTKIINSTIIGNTSWDGTCENVQPTGGGIDIEAGPASIVNSIVTGNTASPGTDEISLANRSGQRQVRGTGPAGPTVPSNCSVDPSIELNPGTLTSGGHNIESATDCGFTASGDQQNVADPKVGALANNGGQMDTMALLTGSPAIDHADAANCPATDEIGTTRPQGAACDVGAFEVIVPPAPPAPPAPTPAKPAAPKVGVAGVRRACVSRSFHVRFHVATSASVKSVVVKLDGRRIKSTSKGSFTLTINSKKLKAGRHRLTITATDSTGQTTTTHKSFSVCKAAKPRRKAAPRFTG
ncbi:MAG TPA: choice-of-anchor Q domain-containing protein, partial [Thermoleophilaceae bacterium]